MQPNNCNIPGLALELLRLDMGLICFLQTSQSLQCVAITDDVTALAAGSADASIRLYDLTSGPEAPPSETSLPPASDQTDADPNQGLKRMWGHVGRSLFDIISCPRLLFRRCGVVRIEGCGRCPLACSLRFQMCSPVHTCPLRTNGQC